MCVGSGISRCVSCAGVRLLTWWNFYYTFTANIKIWSDAFFIAHPFLCGALAIAISDCLLDLMVIQWANLECRMHINFMSIGWSESIRGILPRAREPRVNAQQILCVMNWGKSNRRIIYAANEHIYSEESCCERNFPISINMISSGEAIFITINFRIIPLIGPPWPCHRQYFGVYILWTSIKEIGSFFYCFSLMGVGRFNSQWPLLTASILG